MLLNSHEVETGWQSPNFTLPDANGEFFTFNQLLGEEGLVIAFICNHCPYVKEIVTRLVVYEKEMRLQGINLVAINSNDYRYVPEDSPQMMVKFAQRHNFAFPYLVDAEQIVAKAFNAVCTPDFYGFDKSGELRYRGRLDDLSYSDIRSAKPELLNAMLQIARTGRGPEVQNASIGCSIKWT